MSNHKKTIISLSLTLGIVLGLGFLKFFSSYMFSSQPPMPAQSVTSFIVQEQKWAPSLFATGSLSPVQGTLLSAEESGRVKHIHCTSGAFVQEGDLLIELDTDVERAELESAEAKLKLANIVYRRQQALRNQNANSQSELDEAQIQVTSLKAEVERLQARINKKVVRAPFDGRLGIRQVSIGETIMAGSPLIEITSIEKLFVDFSLPQQSISTLKPGLSIELEVDSFPEKVFHAELTAIGSLVNEKTRTISVQGTIDNVSKELVPGMFVTARVIGSNSFNVLTIPVSGVHYTPYGTQVYIISPAKNGEGERSLEVRVVRQGERRGDLVSILSGLNAGEEVVSSGTFKLFPGALVSVNNSVTPASELQPSPEDA